MPTKAKIKIDDDTKLRAILDAEYEICSQVKLCKYALLLATHILEVVRFEDKNNIVIQEGFRVNEQWQNGNARTYDVRQAGFKIHQMAKECDDLLSETTLRVVGQAVATGHMREHAMVASDYAIKVINLMFPNDENAVRKERLWQIKHLKKLSDK